MNRLIGAGHVGTFGRGAAVCLPFSVQGPAGFVQASADASAICYHTLTGQDCPIGVSVVNDLGGPGVVRVHTADAIPDGGFLPGLWMVVFQGGVAGDLGLGGLLVGSFTIN